MLESMRVAAAVASLVVAVSAQVLSFDDFSWALTGGVAAGPSTSLTSSTMTVEGGGVAFCPNGYVHFEPVAPYDGTVRVHLDWDIFDICHFDWPAYVVNGVPTKIEVSGDSNCFLPGEIDVEFDVAAGDTFALGVGSADCLEGPGVATYTEFVFASAFWVDTGGALDPRLDWIVTDASDEDFGVATAFVGDVDGDTNDDLAVGSRGFVRLLSGVSGAPRWSVPGGSGFGAALAAPGDVTADGVADVITSDASTNRVSALSGADGAEVWSWQGAGVGFPSYGASLAAHADVDVDGFTDVAVAASVTSLEPIVVLSGASGAVLQSIDAPAGADRFGGKLAALGDVSGDGVGDLAFFVRDTSSRVAVHSGLDGSLLYDFELPGITPVSTSPALAAVGDVDGDGFSDFAVGQRYVLLESGPVGGLVTIRSGVDGAQLVAIPGELEGSDFGSALAAGGDVDGDGRLDLAIGAPDWTTFPSPDLGRVFVVCAVDRSEVATFEGTIDRSFGAALALGSAAQLAIGAPGSGSGAPPGEVVLVSDVDHPAGRPYLNAVGAITPGTEFVFRVSRGLAGNTAFWVVGGDPLGASFKGGTLVPQPTVVFTATLNASGSLQLVGEFPTGPLPPELFVQVWMPDAAAPAGWSATQGRAREE